MTTSAAPHAAGRGSRVRPVADAAAPEPRRRGPSLAMPVVALAAVGLWGLWPRAAASQPAVPPDAVPYPGIEDRTAGMERIDGWVPLHWDGAGGRLYLEIGSLGVEMLHTAGLAAGLGSNDLGLDRGALAGSQVVMFERVGPKVLLVQPNYRFRSSSTDPEEVRAVRDAFARSVLWGFTIAAESDGRVLVDATDWLLRDGLQLASRLRPGGYELDASRSTVYRPGILGFPRNTEIEVELTWVLKQPPGPPAGGAAPDLAADFGARSYLEGVGDVAASREAASLRVHHSLVALPDGGGFRPLADDPRAGFFATAYQDRSAGLGEPLERRLASRHRLVPADPSARSSRVESPIVYYLDPGTPEPYRSAVLEGARWWADAFAAAGLEDAFRVVLRPAEVHPLDARYNVINWVHRSTRGWSIGDSVVDPRTGEILKGVVTLGSLRVRQDYLLAEGLLSPYRTGDEDPPELEAWALARLRQLAAHEVGHTLGLEHNYYSSSLGRISVMDYPHPLVTLDADGGLDTSAVYARGIGEWDKLAIAWGYGVYPDDAAGERARRELLDRAWERDLRFLTNQDLEAHPRADWWANGTDAAAELLRLLDVRRAALARFGETAIRRGRPLATIEEALVPLFLHHRYQLEAAASVLGGQDYAYALRGDGRTPWRPASAAAQRAALAALLRALDPVELALPVSVLRSIPPRPPGWGPHRELFRRFTGSTFDAVAPAVVAAELTVSLLLDPERAARLVEQRALDAALPGLEEVIDALLAAVAPAAGASPYQAEIRRAVERVAVERLMALAAEAPMAQVRATATATLVALAAADATAGGSREEEAHRALLVRDLRRFLDRPAASTGRPAAPAIPPGPPIGEPALDYLRALDASCRRADG